jgi:light-regulated signal transduction histidine kinase (bacteriophytochrome)
MDLLMLFAEQSALALEQSAMLDEQKTLVIEQKRLLEQLQVRTAQLEESNQELEAFSYSVSHDLRAPLRHIEGFTDFLFKTGVVETNDKAKRYLTLIAEAARRMGRLIDNLLTFSRLGRAAFNITLVDLDGLVRESQHELMMETENRNINWKIGRLPRVHGDADLLRQVFTNLLSNAVKYTRPRETVEIEIDCKDDQLDGVLIYVRDNGVGFDMTYSDKLFGVFQRLHHNDEFEGTGIGLANVRRIVHRHGGRIWAESAPGEGATFFFTLPSTSLDVVRTVAASGAGLPVSLATRFIPRDPPT